MTDSMGKTVDNQEIIEVLTEFEQYRERLINETMETAKKAKLMKKTVMAQLEPELAKIDAIIQNLRMQLEGVGNRE
ncbi:hypothetical protein [Calothrix sp. NIES-3974]|uniref:hypothetical protein n=1 Tax=Calothrix sp. NIES-3974 TaxID=2005462 RepID=UPI000B5F5B90|nr:hypothetical protein [Calothrix sp. NIES-3974]BAZ06865.1 hypothetical protein NIES3974_35270 [Calothrix sp. NIES-3974]